jgi:Flp pilus assembly protein TadD
VLAVRPEDYGSYLTLGISLARSGEFEAALANLQKAAALRPEAHQPHGFLAALYARLGRDADAERERAEAKRLRTKPSEPANAAPDGIPRSADQN